MRPALLAALLCFAVAALVARRAAVPPPPPPLPPPLPPPSIRITAPPTTPEERVEALLAARDWPAVERLLAAPAFAGHPRLAAWRDHLRRGRRRDAEGIIESPVLAGQLGAIAANEQQRQALREISPEAPYTLPEKRRQDLLVLAPKRLDTELVERLVDELRILRIEGLELNCAGRPLPELGGVRLRYLGGSAIDRLPPAVFAGCPAPEVVDLSSRKEAVSEVIAALAGRRSLRILRLPVGQPLGPIALSALASLDGLDELTANSAGLSADAVIGLSALPRLRSLRLENQLPPAAFAALGRLAPLRRLTCSLAAGVDLAPLAALADLEELTLAVAAPGTASPEWLRFVRARTLRLSGAGIDDRHAEAIRRMPLLDCVELSSTAITDAGLLRLAFHPQLQALVVGANPGLTGAVLPNLLAAPGLRELTLSCDRIPPGRLLTCPDPGQLTRFHWGGTAVPSGVIDHLIAWPGMVRVSIAGKLDQESRNRLNAANERRSEVPPDLPGASAVGF